MNQLTSERGLYFSSDNVDEGEFSSEPPAIEQILAAILGHRYWVLGAITGALLLGLLFTFLATPQYTSTVRLEILPDSPVSTSVEGARDADLVTDVAFYNTQYSLLESRSLAERVVRAGNLAADKEFLEAFSIDGSTENLSSRQRIEVSNSIVAILLDRLTVAPVRSSSLVDISFATPSPRLSMKLANLWATQFVQANIDRRFAATSDARKYLEARLETLRQNLETSERALINYATSKGIVTIASETDSAGKTQTETLVGSDISEVSKALARAREARIAAESELNNTMTGTAQINAPTISMLRQKRAEIEAELARLRTIFEDDYPAVASLRAQLNNLDRSLNVETSRSTQGNREAYNAAVRREKQLTQELDRLTGDYNRQQRESIEMAILQREVDSNRQLYEGLLQRYKEIGVAGVGTNNIAVVDRAKLADRPSSPNLKLNLAVALLMGLGLAAVIVFLLEKMDSSIRDPHDVQNRFGLPLLGAIPAHADFNILSALTDKKSVTYESYFSVMTNLSFLTEHGAPRSMMVTSSQPGEGKSSSSLSVATVLAATGKSVILVDADLRNPSLNRYLELQKAEGLSHYLTGEENIDKLIVPLPALGFSIMPAGRTPPNAAEILGSERFGALIDRLLGKFDHVLIDSAPLLGLADAPLIARRVEGVLFVIEANSTRNRSIGAALARLRMSGAKIFGAIVSKVGVKNQIYAYGYGYDYGYRYGREAESD